MQGQSLDLSDDIDDKVINFIVEYLKAVSKKYGVEEFLAENSFQGNRLFYEKVGNFDQSKIDLPESLAKKLHLNRNHKNCQRT